MTTSVVVRTRIVGFHHWPTPAPNRTYLGARHRHVFHVELGIDVTGDDREIEFHDLLDVLCGALGTTAAAQQSSQAVVDFGSRSCEQIAKDVLAVVAATYGERTMRCSVFEDGENGAEVRT